MVLHQNYVKFRSSSKTKKKIKRNAQTLYNHYSAIVIVMTLFFIKCRIQGRVSYLTLLVSLFIYTGSMYIIVRHSKPIVENKKIEMVRDLGDRKSVAGMGEIAFDVLYMQLFIQFISNFSYLIPWLEYAWCFHIFTVFIVAYVIHQTYIKPLKTFF